MKFKPNKLRKQTIVAKKKWLAWWDEYQADPELTIAELAKRHINPKNGKPYNRASVYYAFKRLEELTT